MKKLLIILCIICSVTTCDVFAGVNTSYVFARENAIYVCLNAGFLSGVGKALKGAGKGIRRVAPAGRGVTRALRNQDQKSEDQSDISWSGAFIIFLILAGGLLGGLWVLGKIPWVLGKIGIIKLEEKKDNKNTASEITSIPHCSVSENIETPPAVSPPSKTDKYNLVYAGVVADGHNLSVVKDGIAELFDIPIEKAEKLFTGKRMILKQNLDLETAQQYYRTIEAKGAICQIEYA